MITIQVYEPALCCNSGVCGPDVDPALVSFSADVDWAKQKDIAIERFNLAQQPQAFAANSTIRTFLEQSGQDGLPLILVDGRKALAGRYPTRDQLVEWAEGGAEDASKMGAFCRPASEAGKSKKGGCC